MAASSNRGQQQNECRNILQLRYEIGELYHGRRFHASSHNSTSRGQLKRTGNVSASQVNVQIDNRFRGFIGNGGSLTFNVNGASYIINNTRIDGAANNAPWLPHVSAEGLDRLTDLLSKASPMLIHGAFTRAVPMGCLASHIAWNHPQTCQFDHEAGVFWLSRVAGLNPATSAVILAWDRHGVGDFQLRTALLEACRDELAARTAAPARLRPAEYAALPS